MSCRISPGKNECFLLTVGSQALGSIKSMQTILIVKVVIQINLNKKTPNKVY